MWTLLWVGSPVTYSVSVLPQTPASAPGYERFITTYLLFLSSLSMGSWKFEKGTHFNLILQMGSQVLEKQVVKNFASKEIFSQEIKTIDSVLRLPGLNFYLCYLLAVWSGTSYLTSRCLGFPMCKMNSNSTYFIRLLIEWVKAKCSEQYLAYRKCCIDVDYCFFEPLLSRFRKKRFGVVGLFWLSITLFLLDYLASSILRHCSFLNRVLKTDSLETEGAVHRQHLKVLRRD